MEEPRFKIGQIVELTDYTGRAAKEGARAKVVEVLDDYIKVEWIKGTGARGQSNGGYYPSYLKPVLPCDGHQLLFNFMC